MTGSLTHLVVVEELLIGFNDPLGIDRNVLHAIHNNDLCVAVWIAAVIDEPRKATLRTTTRNLSRQQL